MDNNLDGWKRIEQGTGSNVLRISDEDFVASLKKLAPKEREAMIAYRKRKQVINTERNL